MDSVLSVSSQTDTCGINPLDEHSVPLPRDVNSIGNGTNDAPLHYDIADFSMHPDNSSAPSPYHYDMLEGLEETIIDEVLQSSMLLSTHSHDPWLVGGVRCSRLWSTSQLIWPAVQSLRRGLSTNPGATMWCVCGCS